MRVRLSADAKSDVDEAKKWYAGRAPGLDLRFRDELDSVLQKISGFPDAFPIVYRDIRRANLDQFPYAICFVRRRSESYVLAVVHHARHPRTWQSRSG